MKNTLLKITIMLASMMTIMAGAIVAPALPLMKEQFSHYPYHDALSNLIITIPALGIILMGHPVGRLVDKIGRLKVLSVSLILYAITGTAGCYLNELYSLLAIRLVLGFAVSGIMTSTLTLIGDYFSGEERNAMIGLQGAFISLGGVVFVIASGLLADIDWHYTFSLYAFSIPVLFMVLLWIREPKKYLNDIDPQDELDIAFPKKLSWIIFATAFVGIALFFLMVIQIPHLLEQKLGVSYFQVGLVIAIALLSGAMVGLNFKRIRRLLSFPLLYAFGFLFMGIGYFFVSISDQYYEILGSVVLAGFGTGLMMPAGNIWIMAITPVAIRGRIIGRLAVSSFLGQFLSPFIFQPIIDISSFSRTFYTCSIFLFGLFSFFFFYYFTYYKKISRDREQYV